MDPVDRILADLAASVAQQPAAKPPKKPRLEATADHAPSTTWYPSFKVARIDASTGNLGKPRAPVMRGTVLLSRDTGEAFKQEYTIVNNYLDVHPLLYEQDGMRSLFAVVHMSEGRCADLYMDIDGKERSIEHLVPILDSICTLLKREWHWTGGTSPQIVAFCKLTRPQKLSLHLHVRDRDPNHAWASLVDIGRFVYHLIQQASTEFPETFGGNVKNSPIDYRVYTPGRLFCLANNGKRADGHLLQLVVPTSEMPVYADLFDETCLGDLARQTEVSLIMRPDLDEKDVRILAFGKEVDLVDSDTGNVIRHSSHLTDEPVQRGAGKARGAKEGRRAASDRQGPSAAATRASERVTVANIFRGSTCDQDWDPPGVMLR